MRCAREERRVCRDADDTLSCLQLCGSQNSEQRRHKDSKQRDGRSRTCVNWIKRNSFLHFFLEAFRIYFFLFSCSFFPYAKGVDFFVGAPKSDESSDGTCSTHHSRSVERRKRETHAAGLPLTYVKQILEGRGKKMLNEQTRDVVTFGNCECHSE